MSARPFWPPSAGTGTEADLGRTAGQQLYIEFSLRESIQLYIPGLGTKWVTVAQERSPDQQQWHLASRCCADLLLPVSFFSSMIFDREIVSRAVGRQAAAMRRWKTCCGTYGRE